MGSIRVRLQEGGEGSGNFGHEGRPGEIGGSSTGGGGSSGPKQGFKEKIRSKVQSVKAKIGAGIHKARADSWRAAQVKKDRAFNKSTVGKFRSVHGELVKKSDLRRVGGYKSPHRKGHNAGIKYSPW